MTSRSRAVALLLAFFVVGLLCGAAAAAFAGGLMREDGHRGRGGRGYVERLTAELDLDAAQQDSLRAILDRYEPAFDSAWAEVRPRIETLRAGIRSEVRTLLTTEQRTEYDSLVARRSRRDSAPNH